MDTSTKIVLVIVGSLLCLGVLTIPFLLTNNFNANKSFTYKKSMIITWLSEVGVDVVEADVNRESFAILFKVEDFETFLRQVQLSNRTVVYTAKAWDVERKQYYFLFLEDVLIQYTLKVGLFDHHG